MTCPGEAPERARNEHQQDDSNSSTSLSVKAYEFVLRLDQVINRGENAWSARCPAHDDKSPSLSVRVDSDKILVHCFAGCSAADVLEAVGMTFSDLYPDKFQSAYASALGARKMPKPKPAFDVSQERLILQMAIADLQAGLPLSMEDRARVEVARSRVRSGGA